MSLITSLFCPLCQKPYDEEEKRPRLGTCRHSVCHHCLETTIVKSEFGSPWRVFNKKSTKLVDCPICDRRNAFKEVSYNFELCRMIEAFNEKVTEENFQRISDNPKKLDLGVCKLCLTTERLRMCMTCAESSRLFKKLPNGKYQLRELNKPFFIAKSVYFCSDCIADGQPDHRQHLFLPLSKIEMREIDLEHWYYIIHAMFLDKKLDEEVHHENAQSFKLVLSRLKRQALGYEVWMRSNPFRSTEDLIKLRFRKHLDVMSLPELARAKEKSFQEAQKVIARLFKLEERHLWWHKYQINMMVERHKQDYSKDPTLVKLREDLSALATKFNTIRLTELSQSEADQIDQHSDAKVEEAMFQLLLPDLGPDKKKFYAYKAISNLLQNAVDRGKEDLEKLGKEFDSFLEFFDNRYQQIEEEMKTDPLVQRLFLYEITERSLKVDKLKVEQLEGLCDWREGLLIWERWFANHDDSMSEDAYYHQLLSQKFDDGQSLTDKLFYRASNIL